MPDALSRVRRQARVVTVTGEGTRPSRMAGLMPTTGRVERAVVAIFTVVWLSNVGLLLRAWLVPSSLTVRRGLVVTLVALMLFFLVYRHLVWQVRLRRAIETAYRKLGRLQDVAEASLANVPLDRTLDELLVRIRSVTEADAAAVLLLDGDNQLVVHAAHGLGDAAQRRATVLVGHGLTGRVAATGRPMVAEDVRSLETPLDELRDELASAAAWPLIVDSRVIGVVVVGNRQPRVFTDEDLKLLELVADRTALAVEQARLAESQRKAQLSAEHARRHLTLLGEASRAMLQSVDDYATALSALIEVALPRFADFGAIYLGDSRRPRCLVARHADPARADAAAAMERMPDDALEPVRRVMATGKGQLVKSVPAEPAGRVWTSYTDAMSALGLTSYVIAPIRVRGLAFGAITFGTAGSRRGYRPSDLEAVEEVAGRAALAIERVELYRETRDTAELSARQSERLYTLLEAWPSIVGATDRGEIVRLAVQTARRTLRAAEVQLWLADQADVVAREPADSPPLPEPAWAYLRSVGHACRAGAANLPEAPEDVATALGSAWIAVPIARFTGSAGGVLLATGTDRAFSDQDEALLGLLAEMVSVTLMNARLYHATQSSEARLAALIDSSPVAIVDVAKDGSVRSWNPAAEAMFGPATVHDSGRIQLFDRQIGEWLRPLGEEARRQGKPVQRAFTLQAEDGTKRSLTISVAPVQDGEAADPGLLVVATEETEQRRLAEQFQQAQRLEAVGRLAGGVAHDFNNLLTVILGYTDGLLRKMDPDDPYRDRIAAIHRAGSRGAELTRKLLTISRREVVNPVVLRPAEVVTEVADMLRRLVGEDVRLTVTSGEDDGAVRIDRGQFEQVLFNLAVNARDAMPEGGDLLVETRAAGPAHVEVSVRDTGTGMDEDTLEHCLEPFFTTKAVGKGTGLGLAAVYGIVTQGGGELQISSRPGAGTTVTARLPRVDAEPEESETVRPLPSRGARQRFTGDVLLVEDESDLRALARRILKEAGYTVLAAASGEEALQLLVSYAGPIDLLLTDVVMPGMSGAELAQRLQAQRQVPVVFMTGYAEQLVRHKLGVQGLVNVLRKPFTPEELLEAVRDAIEAVRARTGNQLRAQS